MADRLLTPQQENFLAYYTDPRSETFSNALQSALRAGYTEEYANNITSLLPDWLSESMGDLSRLRRAEKRLDQILDLEPVDKEGNVDNALIANQMKGINLVAKGIGKNKYSERTELTGAKGGAIEVNDVSKLSDDQLIKLARGSQEGVSQEGTSKETV